LKHRDVVGLAVAVLAITLSARAAIVAGPERQVAKPSPGLPYGTHVVEAVASDGTNFLVAWTNANAGVNTLYLSVVGPDGTPLADLSAGVHIDGGRNASIVWTGDVYLVAYIDDRNLPNVARVGRNGQLDGAPVVVRHEATELRGEALAWYGHRALLTYRDARSQQQSFAILDDYARIVTAYAFGISGASSIVVSATADHFLVVWSEYSSVYAATVFDDGYSYAPAVVATGLPSISSVTAAPDGDRIAVGFMTANSTFHRAFVTPQNASVERLAPVAVTGSTVRLIRSGSEVLAYWPLYRDGALLFQTMSFTQGALRETRIGSSVASDVRAASNGQSLLAVWSDRRVAVNVNDTSQLLNAALLDARGTALRAADVRVAASPVSQGMPSIASAGAVSLVAWIDQKETVRGDLMARRVDSRGVAIDAVPILVEKDVPANHVPVAGFTGQVWIVAYASGDGSQVSYRRLSANGALIDDAAKILGIVTPTFAANAKTSVFAGSIPSGIGIVRFTPAGEKVDPIPLLLTARSGFPLSIAAADDQFLAVWSEGSNWWQLPSPNLRDVYAARLDGSGAPIDAAPIAIAGTTSDEGNAVAASNGHDFVVAYVSYGGTFAPAGDLRVKRVLHEGVVGADKLLASEADDVHLTASNERYFIAYKARFVDAVDGVAVRVATIDDDGAFLDPPSLLDRSDFVTTIAPVETGVLLGYRRTFEAGSTRAILRPVTTANGRNRGVRH